MNKFYDCKILLIFSEILKSASKLLPTILFVLSAFGSVNLSNAFADEKRDTPPISANLQPIKWPQHTVRIVVGFPAGSTPDIIARSISEPLSKLLGQAVIVENHIGVSGNLAAQLVARAHDDHTLGLLINGNLTTAKLLYPNLEFDPLQDFSLISLIADSPLVLVAPINLPTGKQFIKLAQTEGNHWNYGSVGTGSMGHLAMEALKAATPGLEAVHIPYPGNPGVMNALMAGEIQMALVPVGVAMPLVRSEKIQAIGLLGGKSILAPNTLSLSELGIKGVPMQLQVWDALVGPKGLSNDARTRLSKEIAILKQSNELRTQLFNQGWMLRAGNQEALKNVIDPEYQLMLGLINKNKFRISP